jgi:TRAP transporter TAXI family solute receptor
MKRMLAPALAVVVAIGAADVLVSAQSWKFVVIGGGSETGVYYQVALGVCTLVNEKLEGQGYTCVGRPTLGSVFNIKSIRRGLLKMGLAQSDQAWNAYKGRGEWGRKPYEGLRSMFSVHPETVMLVTRADTGIKSVTDLRGKRVNIGNPGSGHRANAKDVLQIFGIEEGKDIITRGFDAQRAIDALTDKKIDALFYTVGNPWKGGVTLAKRTQIRMIPIDGPGIQQFVASREAYVMTVISGGIYQGVDEDVPTYAVKAVLVTRDKESEEVVYNVVKTVFENLDRFRKMNATFASLQPQDMLKGLAVPLHPGAARYYKEQGWM